MWINTSHKIHELNMDLIHNRIFLRIQVQLGGKTNNNNNNIEIS